MRLIVNYYIGLRCTGKDLVFTLNNAIKDYRVFNKDQLLHELIPPATPNRNAHIEAFNSILEIEFLQPRYFMTYGQAYLETT